MSNCTPGFAFRYRVSGRPPTVERFVFKNTETLSRGDMLNLKNGEVALGRTGDTALVGAALETLDGSGAKTSIRAIIDADAVYAVQDDRFRLKGATLDLAGPTGAQGLRATVNSEFVVDVDSSPVEETLVRIHAGRHYIPAPDGEPEGRAVAGQLNAAIARTIVHYYAEQLGRGPTKARAFYHDNVVVVLLENVMTKADRTLAAAGRASVVLSTRQTFQQLMRPYLRSTIERLTGCKVTAFMSTNHVDPDLAAEVFVLDRPVVEGGPGGAAPGAP
jgi:uncharacterized protein YbcI